MLEDQCLQKGEYQHDEYEFDFSRTVKHLVIKPGLNIKVLNDFIKDNTIYGNQCPE